MSRIRTGTYVDFENYLSKATEAFGAKYAWDIWVAAKVSVDEGGYATYHWYGAKV